MSRHQGVTSRARWFAFGQFWRRKPTGPKLRGHLDLQDSLEPVIQGWLAMPGDERARTALLHFDGVPYQVQADRYRPDLEQNGINRGAHAFKFTVPPELADGKPHEVTLHDVESGKAFRGGFARWGIPRTFTDFDGFLRASLTLPLMPIPFREEDKRAFAVSDNIATQLATEGLRRMGEILVTVVMPVRDRADTVLVAVKSVLDQSYTNFELIVVDDASQDETCTRIGSVGDPRVHVIRLERHEGVSAARNAALSHACGRVVAYLDSDNTWDERYLAAMVGAHCRVPDADGWYCGQLLYRDQSDRPSAVRFGAFNRALVENRNYIDLNAFCHTRDAVEAIGGFDTRLRRFVDWDLILRLSEVGKICSVPVLLSRYFYDKASNTLTNNDDFMADVECVRDGIKNRLSARRSASRTHFELVRPVTVIIPSHQALTDLKDCLEALWAAPYRGQLHIVVVDNASSAPVVDYLLACELAGKITLVRNDINYGFSHAVNQGLDLAETDSDVFLLNNDAVVAIDAIPALQQASHTLPECGIVVPRQVLPAGTRTIEMHVPYADGAQACDVNLSAHHQNILHVPLLHDGGPIELSFAPFFAAYIRREVLSEHGHLDAALGRHYRSDRVFCDLVRRVQHRRIYYQPSAIVHHKLQRSTDELMADPSSLASSTAMLATNAWEPVLAHRLGLRRAEWDV